MSLAEGLEALTRSRWGLALADCDAQTLYSALRILTRERSESRPAPAGARKLYYFSAEFLTGKLLSNNLLALGLFDEAQELFAGLGKSLSQIEEFEPEPSLGNGGLGRLAAKQEIRKSVHSAECTLFSVCQRTAVFKIRKLRFSVYSE